MDWNILLANWHVKFVCLVLIVAAYIDGKQLRVPNWITFPMVFSGLLFNTLNPDGMGFLWALVGMFVGLLCLLPLYAVGGMGAGDVKLMAGVGAWLGWQTTLYSFAATAIVGAVMAIVMVWYRKSFVKHYGNLLTILHEWKTLYRNPRELSRIAAERKPSMFLLPYGIPICIGSIGYFFFAGLI